MKPSFLYGVSDSEKGYGNGNGNQGRRKMENRNSDAVRNNKTVAVNKHFIIIAKEATVKYSDDQATYNNPVCNRN